MLPAEVVSELSRLMVLFAVSAYAWLGVREGVRWIKGDG